ncbi:MAG: HAD family hydrolase [Proteobacteria bacterium]|nr:HAD family hydrolase [Pseudomonadota bacterium]
MRMPAVSLPAPASATAASRSRGLCAHCGFPTGDDDIIYCCGGCETVATLLAARGLGRYYELREDACPVPTRAPGRHDTAWLEPIIASLAAAAGPQRVVLDVQGLRCAACVWLLETLFSRRAHGLRLDLNPALGRIELLVAPGFDLAAYAAEVESFGYQLGPARRATDAPSNGLLHRLGLSVALSMNAMLFAFALYAGLDSGPLYHLFHALVFVLTTATVVIGGAPMLRGAWQGLRHGVLNLDLPIALGIVLAYGSSTVALFTGHESAAYFDTIAVFVTLMLLGRFLQERVLERNRRALLDDAGLAALRARRVTDGRAELVPCAELVRGDRLIVATGELVAVDARTTSAANISLDWISGEATPRHVAAGEIVPAGAFNVGAGALELVAEVDFAGSGLLDLLRTPRPRPVDDVRRTPWWRLFTRAYVGVVLALGALTLGGWLLVGDANGAVRATAAVLIVTCPCAFGIATPLAYELAQAGLRRAGLLVRSAGFLDRAGAIRRAVFDKTGTLTTGTLHIADPAPLVALTADERDLAYSLAAQSAHPRSAAVAAALVRLGARLRPGLAVSEEPGAGVVAESDGRALRLGAPAWAAGADAAHGDVAFSVDGQLRAQVQTREHLRPDAARELAALTALGIEPWILSGDTQYATSALAVRVGVPTQRALGAQSPDAKAAWLGAHDHGDALMIGDGINDGLAVAQATCSGTPAIDRPFLPARTDFVFITPGLRPVRLALLAARRLRAVTRRNLTIAIAYNLLTVSLAATGHMTPLLCAVVMPLSSLSVVLTTTWSLSRRSTLWKS